MAPFPTASLARPGDAHGQRQLQRHSLWLLWTASELRSRPPHAICSREQAPTLVTHRAKDRPLGRCFRHLVENVGTGEHGLSAWLVITTGIDALRSRLGPAGRAECVERGESGFQFGHGGVCLRLLTANLLAYAGEDSSPPGKRPSNTGTPAAPSGAGQWLAGVARPDLWIGWGEKGRFGWRPQPWAVIARVHDAQQSKEAGSRRWT